MEDELIGLREKSKSTRGSRSDLGIDSQLSLPFSFKLLLSSSFYTPAAFSPTISRSYETVNKIHSLPSG